MIESFEFWSLFVAVIAGLGVEVKYLIDIREKVSANSERIAQLETKTEMEFEKCRLHKNCGGLTNE